MEADKKKGKNGKKRTDLATASLALSIVAIPLYLVDPLVLGFRAVGYIAFLMSLFGAILGAGALADRKNSTRRAIAAIVIGFATIIAIPWLAEWLS